MNSNQKLDLTVNREEKTVKLKRKFLADLNFIWDAWTKPELLDLWWAPEPFKAQTKMMDFTEGGTWLYAMIDPNGKEYWWKYDFQKIHLHSKFIALDALTDKDGSIDPSVPRNTWTCEFNGNSESTEVKVTINYVELAYLEKTMQEGFAKEFNAALDNLDRYVQSQHLLRAELRKNNKPRVCTYLNFPGNTEEAFLFYKAVFKSELSGRGVQRFGDIPLQPGQAPLPDELKKLILHIELPILNGHVLMATDSPKEMGFELTRGNNMHICLEPDSKAETKRIFDELASKGNVTMPIQDMFFGAYYGAVTDQYGINWVLNFKNT